MKDRHPETQRWLTICAWTGKIQFKRQWLSVEDYLKRAHGISVTHGICPDAISALGPSLPATPDKSIDCEPTEE